MVNAFFVTHAMMRRRGKGGRHGREGRGGQQAGANNFLHFFNSPKCRLFNHVSSERPSLFSLGAAFFVSKFLFA
jgi:hypothetical protein